MRITLATRIFSPEPAAASFRLAALADALATAGHEVVVLTSQVPGDPAASVNAVVKVRRAPVLRDRDGYLRGYVQYMSFDIPLFFRLLFSRRSDSVVAEPPPTTGVVVRVTSWLRRTPYVYYAADIWSDAAEATGAPTAIVWLLRSFEKWSLSGAAHVVAVTEGVADRVQELTNHDRVSVVTNGIDTAIFTDVGAPESTAPLAAYTGTTSEWQGAEVFIDAMPEVLQMVPDARLVFLGQGSAWEQLRAHAHGIAADAIEFRAVAPPEQAAALLRKSRVALVSLRPGIGYDFAMPTKIFAASACGTPVLFAGEGTAANYVSGHRLGQATSWSAAEVAPALIDALQKPTNAETRQRLAEWSRLTVSSEAAAAQVAAIVAHSAR